MAGGDRGRLGEKLPPHFPYQRRAVAVRKHVVSWLVSMELEKTKLNMRYSGTWLSDPIQEGRFGRRPALFVSAVFCAVCVIGTNPKQYARAGPS